MKKFLGLMFLVGATLASGQTQVTRGNFLRIPDYKTTGALSLFVDPAIGVDSSGCDDVSSPCATIMGADALIPRVVMYPVTINLAAGNYSGAFFSQHVFDPASAASGAYIVLQGAALPNAAPATGTATGTASSAIACTVGPPRVLSSLTDSGQTWTVNNLAGFILETTGGTGSGQLIPISSNTSTTITLAGCWGATPNSTTTYAIRTWASVINSTTNSPPNFLSTAGNAIGLGVWGNFDNSRNNNAAFLYVDRVRVSVSTTAGALAVVNSSIYSRYSRFDSSSSGPGVSVGGSSRFIFKQSVATSSTGQALQLGDTFSGAAGANILDSLFTSGATGTSSKIVTFNAPNISMQNSTIRATDTAAKVLLGTATGTYGNNLQGLVLECVSNTTTTSGIWINNTANSSADFGSQVVGINFDSGWINGCFWGVKLAGYNVAISFDDTTLTGSSASSDFGILAVEGSNVRIDDNTSFTGYTTEISIDGVPAGYSDLAALTPPSIRSLSGGGGIYYGAAPF